MAELTCSEIQDGVDVCIYTDGSCSPNPGRGGWAAVLLFASSGKEVRLTGSDRQTTNNRMELTAPLRALQSLADGCQVVLFTDSTYVQKGVTRWLDGWEANGWRTTSGQPVKNKDLWNSLAIEQKRHRVNWRWVKGHGDEYYNLEADTLAMEARRKNRDALIEPQGRIELYPGVTWKHSSGCGSWATVLRYGNHYKVIGGKEENTTANRLYLTAVIAGLNVLKRRLPVTVYTKSGYLQNGLGGWARGWQRHGWQTRYGREVRNKMQWQELLTILDSMAIHVTIPGDVPPCLSQEAKELAREFELY